MRDVRGYRAYQRLRHGWRLLSVALLGLALAPLLECYVATVPMSHVCMSASLGLGLAGSLLTASGSLGGWFRRVCLFVACNFGALLACKGLIAAWGGFPWLTLLLALLVGDRLLRRELGLASGITLVPPGCLLGLLVAPFFWPVVLALGSVLLFLYLVFAYVYVAGAIPRPEDLADQLNDPDEYALNALTRT